MVVEAVMLLVRVGDRVVDDVWVSELDEESEADADSLREVDCESVNVLLVDDVSERDCVGVMRVLRVRDGVCVLVMLGDSVIECVQLIDELVLIDRDCESTLDKERERVLNTLLDTEKGLLLLQLAVLLKLVVRSKLMEEVELTVTEFLMVGDCEMLPLCEMDIEKLWADVTDGLIVSDEATLTEVDWLAECDADAAKVVVAVGDILSV